MIFKYTILYVENVPQTLDFYNRAFGLETGFLHEGGDFGELITGDTKLSFCSTALLQQLGKSPARPDPAKPVFELAFETEDVPAALQKAIAAGATKVQDVREEEWGQTTSYVSDPNGFLVEICSPVQAPAEG